MLEMRQCKLPNGPVDELAYQALQVGFRFSARPSAAHRMQIVNLSGQKWMT